MPASVTTRSAATLAMTEEDIETENTADVESEAPPRTSRFKEHTNTTNSIHPPPDELWKDLGIDQLIEQFNEENEAPPRKGLRKSSRNKAPPLERTSSATPSASSVGIPAISRPIIFGTPSVHSHGTAMSVLPVTPAATEGAFGRFRHAFASVFGNVLGKRKAGHVDAEKEKEKQILDDRKLAAENAYRMAKEGGLLPIPKVFIRPTPNGKTPKSSRLPSASEDDNSATDLKSTLQAADVATPTRPPRTPALYRPSSKKDLQKQKKLSKRVSDLEFKLASARKELHSVLHTDNLPPVPPLPAILPPTPVTSQSEHENTLAIETTPVPEPQSVGKIVKKRKATTIDEEEFKPIPTDSDGDIDLLHSASKPEPEPERTIKRVKSSASRKNLKNKSSRLRKKNSKSSLTREEAAVTVVPDGDTVPPIPSIPKGVKGKKVKIGDDGYGGLGHEMF